MFADLAPPPPDPILGIAQIFNADPATDKVDLGIGIYKDESGEAPILASVKTAEAWLVENQKSKRYLSSAGNPDYNRLTRALLFGAGSDIFERARTIQTPGGTGALRVAADFLKKLRPEGARVFIPDPTWANHNLIFTTAGHEVVVYPYYDVARGTLRFDEMMAALADIGPGDIVLLHGCCHNPAGADPDPAQWAAIAELLERAGAIPLVDLAYLGFGEGLEADAASTRLLAARLPEVIVASSYSKNFALYRDRAGALSLIAKTPGEADRAHAHLLPVVRANYSMPPDHGAAVVAHILGDAALRAQWESEVAEMRARIHRMRARLSDQLAGSNARDYGFIARQRGMFAMLGLTQDVVERMRGEHRVYVGTGGRINIAGLTERNVEHVAAAIATIGV